MVWEVPDDRAEAEVQCLTLASRALHHVTLICHFDPLSH